MSCLNPLDWAGCVAQQVAAGIWDTICRGFADAAADMLKGFGAFFTDATTINLASSGYANTFHLLLGAGAGVAVVVLCLQVGLSVLRRDGAGVARGVTGALQAGVAAASTVGLVQALLDAADQLTRSIVGGSATYDSVGTRLYTVFSHGGAALAAPLLLIFGVLGILVSLVLYLEMIARQAAIVVLVATSPIAMAGLLGDSTRGWWRKTATWLGMLIFLKPVVAAIFSVALNATATASGINGILSALMTLVIAAFAWPALARLLSFTSAGSGGGAMAVAGMAVGGAAARLSGRSSAGSRSGGQGAEPAAGHGTQGGTVGATLGGRGMSVGGASSGGAAPAAGGAAGGASGVLGGVGLALAAAVRASQAAGGLMHGIGDHAGAEGQGYYGYPGAGQPMPPRRRPPAQPTGGPGQGGGADLGADAPSPAPSGTDAGASS